MAALIHNGGAGFRLRRERKLTDRQYYEQMLRHGHFVLAESHEHRQQLAKAGPGKSNHQQPTNHQSPSRTASREETKSTRRRGPTPERRHGLREMARVMTGKSRSDDENTG